MQYIAVVECGSSGEMYVDDIISMGYKPLLIFTYFDKEHAEFLAANLDNVKKRFADSCDIIDEEEGDSIDDLMIKVGDREIICVVPGSDSGVRLADKLNAHLGLRGNDPETTYLRCTKSGMDEALARAGIRHIMTCEVKSHEDVEKFWKNNGMEKAVLKYTESAGTFGLKICDSLEECHEHYDVMVNTYNLTGTKDTPILMQEFIGGIEYIVNSLSVDGKHKITDIWRYEKILQKDGTLAYDTMALVDRLTPGMQEIIQYYYKVLDAVQMKNGFCHSEIKVDEKGPVLIETNARVMGGSMTREYLDEVFGSHMTDVTLKSIMSPAFFDDYLLKPYGPRKSTLMKFAIVSHDVRADLGPYLEVIRHLDSFREIHYCGKTGMQYYPRTVDMETSPFFVRMTNSDYGALRRDYELLRQLEDRYFDMLFPGDVSIDGSEPVTDIQSILNKLPCIRRFAVFTDDGVDVCQYSQVTKDAEWGIFDGAVFAMRKGGQLVDRYRNIMKAMSQIRKGGLFIIIPESYSSLPYGMVGAETLMYIMGIDAEISPSIANGVLYGIKR